MSAPPALPAIAQQLAQSLAQYQRDFDAMLAASMDRGLYNKVSVRLDEIRAVKTAAFPQASSEMVEVLIAHAELTGLLWSEEIARLKGQSRPPGESLAKLTSLREKHRDAVDAMRHQCLRLAAAGTRAAT